MLKTARRALIDLPHHPPKWIEIQFKLNFPGVSLHMSPRMNSCRLQRGLFFCRFPTMAVIFGRHCTEPWASGDWTINDLNSVSWLLLSAVCKTFSFPFLYLSCSITYEASPYPAPFSPSLQWWRWNPAPCIHLLSFTMLHPWLTAFLIKNVWSLTNSLSTVPGPVGPTVKNKHNFAFLKPLSWYGRESKVIGHLLFKPKN